jgi:bromodomain-containing factor 1
LKLKGAYYFAEPVDPVKYNIMDYFDIVTRPMDLNTVRRKLAYNCYGTAGHFMEEMNLVWGNCYKYNGEQHVVSKCAKEL